MDRLMTSSRKADVNAIDELLAKMA
jgi:hypothetical protein